MALTFFVDMDGVIVDFLGGAFEYHAPHKSIETHWPIGEWGTDKTIEHIFDLSPKMFWGSLDRRFWARLNWMPDGREFMDFIAPYKPCLLSSPAFGGADGKQIWIKNNLPDIWAKRRYLLGPAKHYVSRPGAVLIDDHEENCRAWLKHGGIAILYPRLWNNLYHIKDPLKYVKEEIYYYTECERRLEAGIEWQE